VIAHAEDLRAEVKDDALVEAIKTDYRNAELDDATRALLDYAIELTAAPASVAEQDVEHLRQLGWSDRAIHDAAQVTAYFNYINRLADGLGVDLERGMPPKPR
jgi:uncharacterized peroxidase-related enzyme